MYRLLMKDFMLLKKTLWVITFYSFLAFFLFSSENIGDVVYMMGISMISYLLVMYITAFDDRNKSEILINSLPLIRKEVVRSRYISVFIFIITGTVFMYIAGLILRGFHIINLTRGLQLMDLTGASVSILLLCSLYLPLFFKMGYMKAKLFNFAIFGLFFMVPPLIQGLINNMDKPQWIDELITSLSNISDWNLSLIFIGGMCIIYGLSYIISLQFYQRREF